MNIEEQVLNKFESANVQSISIWHITNYFTREEKDAVNKLIKSKDLVKTIHLVIINVKN